MISDHFKESTIRYFIWYHAQNQDRVLDSGEHCVRRISIFLLLNSDITSSKIHILICERLLQNCVIKIHCFVIIKKGEIVRTNLVLHVYLYVLMITNILIE